MMERFHPVLSRWFIDTFDGPSDVQKAAWPAIQDRKNTLIAAPNGSGKTFAAFLSDIDLLVKQEFEETLTDCAHTLFEWEHIGEGHKMDGSEAVGYVLEKLEGVEASATAWEGDILPGRIKDYDYIWLDRMLVGADYVGETSTQ